MNDYRPWFNQMLESQEPILALAPMQQVTDLAFWSLVAQYGGADVYYTEYFRVHPTSRLEKHILRSVTQNPTGRPIVAQLIGNDIASLVRSAIELQKFPVAAVDLNLGCPAPVVYRKCAGGGLLRDLARIDAILGALREAVTVAKFTVKTRIGFEGAEAFSDLVSVLRKHSPDLVTVHGRTVKQLYGGQVRLDLISQAARQLPCPVLANGDINSARQALEVIEATGARGVMLGRGAVRNPWLFSQIRQVRAGTTPTLPQGKDVLAYVFQLYETVCFPKAPERCQVQKMKKYLNFLGAGIGPGGEFLHRIRRTETKADFLAVCRDFLNHDGPLALEPFPSARAAEETARV